MLLRRVLAYPMYKLLAVALALTTWIYVQGRTIKERPTSASIEWQLPSNLLATSDLPVAVRATLRGTPHALRPFLDSDLTVPIDLTAFGPGRHDLSLPGYFTSALPASLEVVSVSPETITVEFDEAHIRKVRVTPTLIGTVDDGFIVDSVVLDPPLVTLKGPRSTLMSLDKVSTQAVDVTGLTRSKKAKVQLDLPRNVISLTNDFEARVTVSAKLEQRVLSSIPVTVLRAPLYESEISEVEVTLEGPASSLRSLAPSRIVAVIHLPEEPERARYEAYFGPSDGVRIDVLHPGGDGVRVLQVVPPMLPVVASKK